MLELISHTHIWHWCLWKALTQLFHRQNKSISSIPNRFIWWPNNILHHKLLNLDLWKALARHQHRARNQFSSVTVILLQRTSRETFRWSFIHRLKNFLVASWFRIIYLRLSWCEEVTWRSLNIQESKDMRCRFDAAGFVAREWKMYYGFSFDDNSIRKTLATNIYAIRPGNIILKIPQVMKTI